MRNRKKITVLLILSLAFSYLTKRIAGDIYYSISKPMGGIGSQLSCPQCLDGFILSYLFFISLSLNMVRADKRKIINYLFFLPAALLINPPYEGLIFGVALILLGYLLAQGILMVKKRMARK
ncbi:MAG: hypothetical protein WCW25_04215 [Patescibacteria group bacterium]|jgi:hypothetical protein